MTARICPKCGCIYDDGRAECTDCGEYTRKADDEELAVFAAKNAKKLKRQSGLRPHRWMYIAAAALTAYSAVLIIVFAVLGWGFAWISVLNLLFAVGLFFPVFDDLTWLYNLIARKKWVFQLRYNYTRLMIGTVLIVIFNIMLLVQLLFAKDGIIVKFMTDPK
ncbi:MAG: hypothetical protein IJT87_07945 [Ruminiclostridium sp.]|nr:hypothetical protein [Ruminiclostridium sp.]